jgi:tetratricopeptide (TPR) repeat protein
LFEQKLTEAEKAYANAIDIRPGFFLGLMNLGRLRMMQKNFAGAIEPLTAALNVNAKSADANYYLGEAYLQVKKGSKAVGYLNEALKLDPIGKADAHLRLATLYNAVGMKDKAAIEYEEFLKKKPGYPDSKKLKEYVDANKPKQ